MERELYISTDRRFFLEKTKPVNSLYSGVTSYQEKSVNSQKNPEINSNEHSFVIPWFLQDLKRNIEMNINVEVKVLDPSTPNLAYIGKTIIYIVPDLKLKYGFDTSQSIGNTTLSVDESDLVSTVDKFIMVTGYLGSDDTYSGTKRSDMKLNDIVSEIVGDLMNIKKMENLKY
ncbi:MAG: hypothetical protein ACYDAO_09870 [Thermoplasmataceae archaeon]